LFAGADRGGQRAAVMHALIGTAKLNAAAPPKAWLANVLKPSRPDLRRSVKAPAGPTGWTVVLYQPRF